MSSPTSCVTPTNCPKCQSQYRMVLWRWIIFSGILLFMISFFFYAQFKKPIAPIDPRAGGLLNYADSNFKKSLEIFETQLRVGLVIMTVAGIIMFVLVIALKIDTNPPCECPKCPVDFPVYDIQLGLLITMFCLPVFMVIAFHYNEIWENNELKAVKGRDTSGSQFSLYKALLSDRKIFAIKIIIICCVTLYVLFILFGFFFPKVNWEKVKETFYFEVSPERKKCLEEQVSRKNFGKPRECSCCGKGTVGGIPPNYDQWLNVDQDTGSRWHRPDNVDYINTFSNGQEAICNSCGPPSYKMYL